MGQEQGCHKCGGYPGHPTKDRSFLVFCTTDNTYTCNQHLTILGACPVCKLNTTRKVMTQRDVKQAKKGGLPGLVASKKGSGSSGGSGVTQAQQTVGMQPLTGEEKQGVISSAFQRGGTEIPQSSGGNAGLQYKPGDLAPEAVKNQSMAILSSTSSAEAGPTRPTNALIEGFDARDLAQIDLSKANPTINIYNNVSGHKNPTISDGTDADTSDEDTETDPLDDLFKDDGTAFNFNNDDDTTSPPKDEENNPDETEEAEDDVTSMIHSNGMTAEEMAAIEEELAAAAQRRNERMAGLGTVQRLQKIASLPLKDVPPMFDFVDALWGLTGATAHKDILHYQGMVTELREATSKNEKLPQFLMGIVSFEPQDDDMLNRAVLDAIKSMIEVYCIIGYGPRTVKYAKAETLGMHLKTLIGSTDQVLGLGVLGLDMHYAPYTLEQQKEILKIQFDIAAELGLLVYINSEKADAELCAFLRQQEPANMPKLVYAGLLNTDEMAEAVAEFDMHLCLRPELTYEANKASFERTKKVNSVRWLPASGMPHSAPMMHSGQWNEIKFIPETLSKFFAIEFGHREPDEFIALCVSNWARLLFDTPLAKEKAGREDIWADYDPNKKLF